MKVLAAFDRMDEQARERFAKIGEQYAVRWPEKVPTQPRLLRLVVSDTAKR